MAEKETRVFVTVTLNPKRFEAGKERITNSGLIASLDGFMQQFKLNSARNAAIGIRTTKSKFSDDPKPVGYITSYQTSKAQNEGNAIRASLSNHHPAANMLEFTGAKPHEIIASKKPLMFMYQGHFVITMGVFHPGFKAKTFMLRAIEETTMSGAFGFELQKNLQGTTL